MKNILVTGASGYLGGNLMERLSARKAELGIGALVATDVRPMRANLPGVVFEKLDVREKGALELFKTHKIDCVVHLASIVTPGKKSNRDFEYSVDVLGTKNILESCVGANVKRVIISSSGAAYGYYPENAKPLIETDPIRGNYEFAYSHHKKLVEEELAQYRKSHPELEQTIFRITTILGKNVKNQITDLFMKPIQLGIRGTDSRFSFIWDEDAVRCIEQAIFSEKTGAFNLSGDGSVSISERGRLLKKPVIQVPSAIIETALSVLKRVGLTQYGPEQTLFLKYRPILDNARLKSEFGFKPVKTSHEVFESFVENKW
jgi:UDP-glucose 4-epimerase